MIYTIYFIAALYFLKSFSPLTSIEHKFCGNLDYNCGVGEEGLEGPLDCKEIRPVHPKGDQSWVFIGKTDVEAETPILWPPHAKS